MGGFGGFNFDVDMDEILRLQEEEELRLQQAAAAAKTRALANPSAPEPIDFAGLAAQYPDIFGGPGPPGVPPTSGAPRPVTPPADLADVQLGIVGFRDWVDDIQDWQRAQGEWRAAPPNPNTGLNASQAIAQLQDPLSEGNWTPEEWAAGQEFFDTLGTPATTAAPATTGAATTTPAAVDIYQQQGIVSPGISDAEQRWLDAAIAGGAFLGDPGIPGDLLGQVEIDGSSVPDPRIGMREDLAGTLLEQGHTVADIEQFLGMDSLVTDEELGTVAGERHDDFAGVGSQEWFEFLAADEDYMNSAGEPGLPSPRENVESALARITETGTATLLWVDSREFAEAYGSPGGAAPAGGGGGAAPAGGADPAGGFVCPPGQVDIGSGVCMPIGFVTEMVCPPGQHDAGYGVCVPDTVVSGADAGGGAPAPAGDGGGDGAGGADGATLFDTPPGDDSDWADPFGDDIVPPGVPVYVNEQVDELNILKNRLKEIKDAHAKLLKSGLANIDDVEQALTDAESDIYGAQYGVLGPNGELLSPGEMDRLLSTWESRRTTSKKFRELDRQEILSIMTDEGVPAGLAKTELDMIQAIHGDSVDAQYDYIDSLWRIGKMSHDERTSMIGNMMSSYRLQLRDTLVEMVMAEEISTAGDITGARQDALRSDTMADLFEGMSENEVFALMRSGMTDLLELPEDKEIGLIEAGEWAGYTEGQKTNVLVTAGWEQGDDGLWTAPQEVGLIESGPWAGFTEAEKSQRYLAAGYEQGDDGEWTAPEEDEIIGLIESGEWAGYTEADKSAAYLRAGYTFADGKWSSPKVEEDKILSKVFPDGTTWTGTAQEYYDQHGAYIFEETDDDRVLSKTLPGGTVWEGTADDFYGEFGTYIFADTYADDEITKDLPDGTPFTGTVAEYVARSGVYPYAAATGADEPNMFTVSVDRIKELDPTGAWLNNSGLEIFGDRPYRREAEGSSGFVTMDWDDWIFAEEPYEAAFEIITKPLPDGTPFRGTVDEYFDRSGQYPFADSGAEDRILTTVVDDQPWRGTAQQFLEEYGRHIFAEPDWRDEILETSVDGKPWRGTADAYFDQHGLYIFGEEIDAPVPVPSGIFTADFPELRAAFPYAKITNESGDQISAHEDGEYWFSPSDSAVYHELMEIREAEDPDLRREDLGGWIVDGPYDDTGVNWPVNARNMVQQEASRLSQDPAYLGFAAVDLSLSAVLANAGRDGPQSTLSGTTTGSFNAAEGLYVFSRLAARYLQKDIPVYDTPPKAGNHTGYIAFETGEFVPNPSYTTP